MKHVTITTHGSETHVLGSPNSMSIMKIFSVLQKIWFLNDLILEFVLWTFPSDLWWWPTMSLLQYGLLKNWKYQNLKISSYTVGLWNQSSLGTNNRDGAMMKKNNTRTNLELVTPTIATEPTHLKKNLLNFFLCVCDNLFENTMVSIFFLFVRWGFCAPHYLAGLYKQKNFRQVCCSLCQKCMNWTDNDLMVKWI